MKKIAALLALFALTALTALAGSALAEEKSASPAPVVINCPHVQVSQSGKPLTLGEFVKLTETMLP